MTNRVYVSSYTQPVVYAIDGDSFVATMIPMGSTQLETPALNPFPIMLKNSIPANLVYVAMGIANAVGVIDQTTNQLIATIPVSGNPFWTAVDPFIN